VAVAVANRDIVAGVESLALIVAEAVVVATVAEVATGWSEEHFPNLSSKILASLMRI